jgi:hypothetical protein
VDEGVQKPQAADGLVEGKGRHQQFRRAAEIDERRLGEAPRAELRRWYWCNVFLERYSSAVESKSRKDYAEMLAHWTQGVGEPSVFMEARNRIGTDGFGVQDAVSHASSVYSGVFSLLALRGARDWRRGEAIQLQDLEDHHIFPRAYLRRHGVTKRSDVNSLVNRTLISDETNRKIKATAPATYVKSAEVFPGGLRPDLVQPHFLGETVLAILHQATDELPDDAAGKLYRRFLASREQAIVAEIRAACGVEGGGRTR